MNSPLSSLTAVNFQSWAHARFDFHPGVNVIVGTNDSGKSALIRVLTWALFNRPSGDNFRSWWAGKEGTYATLRCAEGEATRKRTKSSNQYFLTSGQSAEIELNAVGTEVPHEVGELFNIDNLNVQQQGDGPFLLSLNGSEVARQLNQIARIDDIDKAYTAITGRARTNTSVLTSTRKQHASAQAQLKRFEGLDECRSITGMLLQQEQQLRRLKQRCADLIVAVEALQDCQAAIGVFCDIDAHATEVTSQIDEARTLELHITKRRDLMTCFTQLQARRVTNQFLKEVPAIDVQIVNADAEAKNRESAVRQATSLTSMLQRIKRVQPATTLLQQEVGELEKQVGALSLNTIATQNVRLSCLIAMTTSVKSQIASRSQTQLQLKEAASALEYELQGACPLCGAAREHHCLQGGI